MPRFTQTLNASIEIEVEADDMIEADAIIASMSTQEILSKADYIEIDPSTERVPERGLVVDEKLVEVPESLIEDIHYCLSRYNVSTDRANAGHHFIELFNRVSDLTSYHSGFDVDSGTMPWEREDD